MNYKNNMTLCTFAKTWVTVDINARSVGACCRTPHTAVENQIDINNKWFSTLRNNLHQGIRDERCNSCWQQERTVGTSLRLNGPYTIETDQTDPQTADLQYLEIRLGNQCDGACVYCGGMFSAKQAKFWKLHRDINKPVTKDPLTDQVKQLIKDNAHSIREIVFLGGEPTLMESWYTFLDFIVEQEFANPVTVGVTSNCNWTDKIKQRLFASVDNFLDRGGNFDIRISGEGDKNYFNSIRKFSDYDTVLQNITDLTAHYGDKIKYTLQPVMNGLSVYSLDNWLDVFSTIFKSANIHRVNLNLAMLTRPEEFLTIHQGTRALPSLHRLVNYLRDTDLFYPKQRMIDVVESQIALMTQQPNDKADSDLEQLLSAHDRILPHKWSSTDALP